MKKTFLSVLLTFAVVTFLSVGTIFLTVSASASENEETDTPTVEIATESEKTASEDMENTRISSLIDSITNSSLWISIGSYLLAAIATITVVVKNFNNVKSLIGAKADKDVIKASIKDGVKEMRDTFDAEYKKINAELETHREKEKQMWAILTIFMTHAKIPTAAKAEIMNCITGMKDMTGELCEIVEEAEKAILAAEEEAAKSAVPTPALDEIINSASESHVMELG
jgi:hypothetical protein